jgi:hypothetical protein
MVREDSGDHQRLGIFARSGVANLQFVAQDAATVLEVNRPVGVAAFDLVAKSVACSNGRMATSSSAVARPGSSD